MSDYDDIYQEIMRNNKEFTKEYEIGKVLGKGHFGEVREVRKKNSCVFEPTKQAAKLIEYKGKKGNEEIKIMKSLRYPNIIKTYNTKFNFRYSKNKKHYTLIIMECATFRDLGSFIRKIYDGEFYKGAMRDNKEQKNLPYINEGGNLLTKYFSCQIMNGLVNLYNNDIIHFDIKPKNLLMTKNLKIKISDFSISRDINEHNADGLITVPGGTKGYCPPELGEFKYQQLPIEEGFKRDYFGFGLSIYELMLGEQLLKCDQKLGENDKIRMNLHDSFLLQGYYKIMSNYKFPLALRVLLRNILELIPEKRANFEQIYTNKWISENYDDIKKILDLFDHDEVKIIETFHKIDFINYIKMLLKKGKKNFYDYNINLKKYPNSQSVSIESNFNLFNKKLNQNNSISNLNFDKPILFHNKKFSFKFKRNIIHN